MNMAIKKGIMNGVTLAIVVFPTPQPRNRQVPTGGVHRPIQRLAIMIIPKWTGSIPKALAIGRKIGVNIKTAGVMSMKVPTKRSSRLIISIMTIGLSESPSITWDTV